MYMYRCVCVCVCVCVYHIEDVEKPTMDTNVESGLFHCAIIP